VFCFEPCLVYFSCLFDGYVFYFLEKKKHCGPQINVFYMQMKTSRILLCVVCLALSAQ
jgi:hypothetical protein